MRARMCARARACACMCVRVCVRAHTWMCVCARACARGGVCACDAALRIGSLAQLLWRRTRHGRMSKVDTKLKRELVLCAAISSRMVSSRRPHFPIHG